MATTVRSHQLKDLAHVESQNEILLDTNTNTELHIVVSGDRTVIRLPYGNKFDIVEGCIIIHEK